MPEDACSCTDRQAIEDLLHAYAWSLDSGDFVGMADLFAHGVWFGQVGREAVLGWLERNVILYDGRPRTHHQVSNVRISITPGTCEATAQSYITVFHHMPQERHIQVIAANAYHDEFVKVAGVWRFVSRAIDRRLIGDASRHRRA